jgi:uncharacterized membrane protein YdjX (TVP38/TMEM64 family)
MIENLILDIFFVKQNSFFNYALILILLKTLSGIFFLPGAPLTILSGALLGKFWGTVVSLVGNILGATFGFLLSRYLLKDWVQRNLRAKYPTLDKYENALFKNGFWTVLFLRLVPLFPFNALNFLLAVTEVRFRDYFFGTLLGIIPGTFLFVYFGEAIKMKSYIGVLFAVLSLFALYFVGKNFKKSL